MKRVCLVPARGGSKRLPKKNIKMFAGKPLFCHTIDAIIDNFDKVIFSTDDLETLKIAEENYDQNKNKKFKKIIISKRPPELASDHSKVIDSVVYYFKQFENLTDEIWLALPTCPLRTNEDVASCISVLENNKDFDGVISITSYEFPPTLALTKDEKFGTIFDWHKELPWQNGDSRSQDHIPLFRPNGALYGMRSNKFARAKNFYKGNIFGYFMPRERSIDIDTELDWKLAELIGNE